MARYLFGPVQADYADKRLAPFRDSGDCLTFGAEAGVDLNIAAEETWESIAAHLPSGWQPDFIVLYLPYTTIPAGLWDAPVPLIGLAVDWNLLWHEYRRLVPCCEWIFTDERGVEAFGQGGIRHVSYANLYGWAGDEVTPPETFRDIDVLFVGNLHPAIQADRLLTLSQLAELSDRFRITIRSGVFGPEYQRLYRRAKLVLNRSIRGEFNQRVGEAIAAGALLLQERGNQEVERQLPKGSWLTYEVADLEEQIKEALANDFERCAQVHRAQEAVPAISFTAGWRAACRHVEEQLAELRERATHRPSLLSPWSAASPTSHSADEILACVEAALASQEVGPAVPLAQRALALLWSQDDAVFDRQYYPAPFDAFRVEWERAAWRHAGAPLLENHAKRTLLQWRMHELLGLLTGERQHLYEAAVLRPDLPETRAKLGLSLMRGGLPALSLEHLRFATERLPFDGRLASKYAECLEALGDSQRLSRYQTRCRRLAQAAPTIVPLQPWFAPPRPPGSELASIIVPCCNQQSLTHACAASLIQHTRTPYELVFIDNGSTDGTFNYLESLKGVPGPERVVIIRNPENLGFAVACNQGIREAQGDYLVLLNNDTRVTPHWLERLIDRSLRDWPHVGLVGPVSNYVPPPQHVEFADSELDRLDEFAEALHAHDREKALRVERLSGFCLLLRRDVFRRVGELDASFGLGFFEDDDYCVRVREAGLHLLVALDVFIYHRGSQTFQGLALDTEARLQENFARFEAKWGRERTRGYQIAGSKSPPAQEANTGSTEVRQPLKPGVSACLIMKNEEENVAECIACLRGVANEIIVVDTGSTDRTKEIARELGALVYEFPWVDSFAAARNEALRHASHEWIFWFDADDRLDPTNREKLTYLFSNLPDENVAFSMKCLCLPDPISNTTTVVDHIRLFRNDPRIRWTYRVHEQILPGVRATQGTVRFSEVIIQHVGYQDPALRRRKLDRDLRLLHMELAEQPHDPFVHFNLGSVYLELDQTAKALPHLEQSLARSHVSDSITRKLYVLLIQGYRHLGQWQAALPLLERGRTHFPDDPELLYQEGVLQQGLQNWPAAEKSFRRLLALPAQDYFASVDAGLKSYKARHALGVVLKEQDRLREAEVEWVETLKQEPEFAPALIGLAELYIVVKRWQQFDEVLHRLERLNGNEDECAMLRIRAQLARREFADAKVRLETVMTERPRELWPRVIYSHVWLQEGLDPFAAERALLSILELEPRHREALQNLSVLRAQQQKRG